VFPSPLDWLHPDRHPFRALLPRPAGKPAADASASSWPGWDASAWQKLVPALPSAQEAPGAMPAADAAAASLRLFGAWSDLATQGQAYWLDALQRHVLYWDAMRKRGNLYLEHGLHGKPPLLKFDFDEIMDGRKLARPCNYYLLRIRPDARHPTDPVKRPIVVVDPRAGHGPGIGGFKADSQVGVALRAGHPVYFLAFSPKPVPGQRLSDVAAAEAAFIEKVRALHPGVEKKPAVIGNCQAGWAVAGLAAVKPDIMGPIILNGAPLSYWAGSREQNPMRYAGGVYGGSWPAALAADLGGGEFDGAHLVENFENLNPANTLWSKQYNLYSKIDSEEARYLEFERWWGGYFRMTSEEIESIVDNLFVGNRLARGDIETGAGPIDLHNIASPVVVFASHGDNITPPSQALNWIIDVWGDERAIIEAGRTICYLIHDDIGHLGIFVGSAVARKEHDQLVNVLDQIDILPPGLYEIEIEHKAGPVQYESLTHGDYVVRFSPRTMDDLRALEPDGRRDESVFSTIAKVSAVNSASYNALVRPAVRAAISPALARAWSSASPARLQRVLASDANPAMRVVGELAEAVRAARAPVEAHNWFAQLERDNSAAIVKALDGYRDARDYWTARWVEWLYGPFALGAVFPPDESDESRARDRADRQLENARAVLATRIDVGGFPEGLVRMLLIALRDHRGIYRRSILLAQMAGRVANDLIAHGRLPGVSGPVDWRAIRQEQATILALFPEEAVAALPRLLDDKWERDLAAAMVGRILLREPESADPRSDMFLKAQEALGLRCVDVAAHDDLPPELQAIRLMQAA